MVDLYTYTSSGDKNNYLVQLQQIFKNAPVGIAITKNRKVIFVNPYLIKLLDYPAKLLINKTTEIIYPSYAEFKQVGVKNCKKLNENGSATIETKFKKSNGDVVNVLMNSSFLNGKNDQDGIVSIITDITNQKNTEQSLYKKNKEKDVFISIMAHDLKNSLSNNVQIVNMLISEKLECKKKQLFIKHLGSNFKKSISLLNSLITWGKASQDKEPFQPVALNPFLLIEKNKSLFQSHLAVKNIILVNNISSGITIAADKDMLDFIFRNLIFNALKFTDRNGEIEITCNNQFKSFEFCVRDTGKGMTTQQIKDLFLLETIVSEPGTEGETGHGLGLQIVKEYIRLHKGCIWAESEPNIGTKVFFSIPMDYMKNKV